MSPVITNGHKDMTMQLLVSVATADEMFAVSLAVFNAFKIS